MAAPSSIGANSSSVVSTQNLSVNNQTNDPHLAIKQYALTFLGHGYDKTQQDPSSRLLGRIVQDLSSTVSSDVAIRDASSQDFIAMGETSGEAVEELKKGFKLNFDLSFPSVSLGTSVGYQTSSQSTHQTKKIIFATAHIKQMKCVLNNIPPLNKALDKLDKGCGHLVRSGWVYTGYKVFFEITTQIDQQAQGSELQGGGSIGWKFLGVGYSANSLKNALKNRTVTDIQVRAEGFGDYSIPHISISNSCDLNEIDKVIEKIRDDYIKKAHQIMIRQFIVIEDNLLECSKVPPYQPIKPLLQPNVAQTGASGASLVQAIIPSPNKPDFYDLANRIVESLEPPYKQSLDSILALDAENPLSIEEMLVGMETVFSRIFQNGWDQNRSQHYSHTIVMGYTGAGKSTIVGYQLGAKIFPRELEIKPGEERIWVMDYQSDSENLPSLGHFDSKTKGYAVYQKYIDVAGLLDTEGREVDICNAMAISMATRIFSPNRLIIVLEPGSFDSKAAQFLNIIKKLRKVLRNPTSKKVMPSILFLVNNKIISGDDKPRLTEEHIWAKIRLAIAALKEARDKCLSRGKPPQGALSRWFTKASTLVKGQTEPNNDELQKQIQQLNPKLREKVRKYQEQIEILERVSKDNIIVANCLEAESRRKIDQWESKVGGLNSSSFSMQDLVPNGPLQFKTIITAIITYFNGLFSQKKQLEYLLNQANANIKEVNDELRDLGDLSLTEDFALRNQKNQNTINLLKGKVRSKSTEQLKLEQDRQDKVNEMNHLISSEKSLAYDDIKPTEPIQPRPWWAADWWAKKYSFTYNGTTPLVKVEPYTPTERGKYTEEDKTKLAQGEYRATYLPAWCNNKKDSEAVVKCFVKEKDHPSSRARVQQLKQEISSLDAQIGSCKSVISGYQAQIRNLQKAISDNEQAKQVIEDKQATAALYSSELASFSQNQQKLQADLKEVHLLLDPYQDYCKLIAQIIQGLKLITTANNEEKKFYNEFLKNFG